MYPLLRLAQFQLQLTGHFFKPLLFPLAVLLHLLHFASLRLEISLSLLFLFLEGCDIFSEPVDISHDDLHLIQMPLNCRYLHDHSPPICQGLRDIDPDAVGVKHDAVEVPLEKLHHLRRSAEVEVGPLGNEGRVDGLAVLLGRRVGPNEEGEPATIRSEL